MPIPSRAPAALLSLVLVSCAGNQATSGGPSIAPPEPRPASGSEQERPSAASQDDLSEVAAPAELLALVRSASVRTIASRIARFGVVTEAQASEVTGELLSTLLGGPALARLVHTDRPMDGALVFAGGEPTFVVSLAVPAPSEVLRRLGASTRPISLGNGVFELAAPEAQRSQQSPTDDEDTAGDERSDRVTCFVSPTPNAREGRLTCAQRSRAALESVTPFLARTLPRRALGQEGIVATVFPAAVRTVGGQDALRGIDEFDRELDRDLARTSTGPLARTEIRQPFARILHELAVNLRALVNETSGLDLAVSVDERGLHFTSSVDVRNPTGSLVRGLVEGSRAAPPLPSQNLSRIAGDAGIVLGGSLTHQVWASQAAAVVELLSALARTEARLSAPQVAQLREILTSGLGTDLSVLSSSAFDPQGRPRSVTLLRAADEARANALVANFRRLFAIVRTPSFTRAIDGLLRDAEVSVRVPWAQLRELPTAGLPAGSFAMQLPDFATIANQLRSGSRPTPGGSGPGRRSAAAPPPAVLQYLIVPEGAQVTVVGGAAARTLWTAVNANTGAALDPAARGIRQGALAMSISPAGVIDSFAASPEIASNVARLRAILAQMPDRGATPILFRLSNAEVDGAQRFSFELEVPSSAIMFGAQSFLGSLRP
jgi:hypothetical protein